VSPVSLLRSAAKIRARPDALSTRRPHSQRGHAEGSTPFPGTLSKISPGRLRRSSQVCHSRRITRRIWSSDCELTEAPSTHPPASGLVGSDGRHRPRHRGMRHVAARRSGGARHRANRATPALRGEWPHALPVGTGSTPTGRSGRDPTRDPTRRGELSPVEAALGTGNASKTQLRRGRDRA
jgi:hypothetical protein